MRIGWRYPSNSSEQQAFTRIDSNQAATLPLWQHRTCPCFLAIIARLNLPGVLKAVGSGQPIQREPTSAMPAGECDAIIVVRGQISIPYPSSSFEGNGTLSASGEEFNPQNTQCIHWVKFFAFLDSACLLWNGH